MTSRVAIIGVGEADATKVPGRGSLSLNAQAAARAISDAGLTKNDIDGLLTGYTIVESHFMYANAVAEYLEMNPRYHASIVAGGATPCFLVQQAVLALIDGLCTYCLVVYGDNRGSGASLQASVATIAAARDHPEFETPYGLPALGPEAMMARRHMYEYGTTPEQLATVAVTFRGHASLNPRALRRSPITVEDVLRSAIVADPLHSLDCCLVSNFGGAAILTLDGRSRDTRTTPVYVLGSGTSHSHKYVSQARSLVDFPVRQAADQAFAMAGVSRGEIDVTGVYDGSTITTILNLEGLGFCAPGEGGAFAESGALAIGGALPTNTNGGMLSYAHGGILHLIEVVRQLRGECGPSQVTDARIGLVHGDGASQSSHGVVILGR